MCLFNLTFISPGFFQVVTSFASDLNILFSRHRVRASPVQKLRKALGFLSKPVLVHLPNSLIIRETQVQ